MPRITVEADDKTREVVFWERVGVDDFDADHFRRCLCDRIAWAVADAERVDESADVTQDEPRHERELTVAPEIERELVTA